ncbi:MAG TPA: hypothetical protein VMU34_10195 [Mycobacterium sp.]|nr:hypothetical protein [Mycobacterium sp.]
MRIGVVFPQMPPGPGLDAAREIIATAAAEAGRDPTAIGMHGRVGCSRDPDELADALRSWSDAGATRVFINTMGAGLPSVDDHLNALTSAAEVAKTVLAG